MKMFLVKHTSQSNQDPHYEQVKAGTPASALNKFYANHKGEAGLSFIQVEDFNGVVYIKEAI